MRIAWNNYEGIHKKDDITNWFNIHNLFKENDEIKNKRIECVNKINNILYYSDYHNVYSVFRIFKQ
jgi:hypothetical protein